MSHPGGSWESPPSADASSRRNQMQQQAQWDTPADGTRDLHADDIDHRLRNLQLRGGSSGLSTDGPAHAASHTVHEPSPAKNYSAFGGGLFFQEPARPAGSRLDDMMGGGFGGFGAFDRPPHSHQIPQQQQQQQPGPIASRQPLHGTISGGKSILNEVMSMMQPPVSSSGQSQLQSPAPFPSGPHAASPTNANFPPSALRPPITSNRDRNDRMPPGFGAKAPPGFGGPLASAPGPNLMPNSTPSAPVNFPPTFVAPSLPAPLQNDSHVQCSLCRVIVVNSPQSLFMHDHSPQHIENERRHQQQRQMQQQMHMHHQQQQQQQQQQFHPSASRPPPSLSGPSGPDPSFPPQQPPSSSPSSVASTMPPLGGEFDLASLQSQLRSFMIASEQAKASGLPPIPMDPSLMNRLKMVQEVMHRNQQQQQQQQQTPPPQSADAVSSPPSAAAGESCAPTGPADSPQKSPSITAATGFPSTAGPFPTREALIAASSAVHLLSAKRLNLKRGPNFTVPVNLTFDLRALLQTLQPDPATFDTRREIRRACEQLVQRAWGADICAVRLFGSSVNTLCEIGSDVDLCLDIRPPTVEGQKIDKPAIVEKIADLFQPHFTDILALPKARVPIVKFVSPASGLHCDIGINNHLACRNSELIRDYMQIDSRARDLCIIVKHWAKMRKINDPYRGTLSSYCYVMMVIHYLQNAMHCNPPVLPCLQTIGRADATKEEIEAAKIDGFDCWYCTDIEKLKTFGQANQQSLAELLIGFFRLYSHEFDFKDTVVSIRTAAYLDKKKKVWAESGKKDRQLLCVEDPFDVTHNLSRGCDSTALYEIRGEFMKMFRQLHEGTSIYRALEPANSRLRKRDMVK